eukprot:NODE_9292_length_1434_cov_4.637337.p1 GENE.NODE_9292_length_1434_cov_4.637337~~NODE_9292_length_1434_cov_4.637337.p1  ORF type:complete len:443 (-),score=136.34 NODE_9292_length_1434_cov_4.637337:106-1320(-)
MMAFASGRGRRGHRLLAAAAAAAAAAAGAAAQQPVCMMADALVNSVDAHLEQWDWQIEQALNASLNCSSFLQFVYLSRERIHREVEYVRGNLTEAEDSQAAGAADISTVATTLLSTASSVLSAHAHVHAALPAARPECMPRQFRLLFLKSWQRMQPVLESQLHPLWFVLQGSKEHMPGSASRWLDSLVALLDRDLRTMESVVSASGEGRGFEGLAAAAQELAAPAEPLAAIEAMRHDIVGHWEAEKPLLRALLRDVLAHGVRVADFCAGTGRTAFFLNSTGLVTAYAFDATPHARYISEGLVEHAPLVSAPVLLGEFSVVLCLNAMSQHGGVAEALAQLWRNIAVHAVHGAGISCGYGAERDRAVEVASQQAPGFVLDHELSSAMDRVDGGRRGICIFRRVAAG